MAGFSGCIAHAWDLEPRAARVLQEELRHRVDVGREISDEWETVAAADVSFNRRDPWLHAAVVVIERGTGKCVDRVGVSRLATFPYVPGLLSFREIPPLIEAFERLGRLPDVILCDGQGIAHPRRLGLASHLGLWLGRPTIGCAKSRLCGTFVEPGPKRGDQSPLLEGDERIGTVLRTRREVKPLFVSPGHLCDQASAVRLVNALVGRYRLPEPARLAHQTVNRIRTAIRTEWSPRGSQSD